MASSPPARRWLAVFLALLGSAALVYGSWIPLRGELSQVLLRVAWHRASEASHAEPAPVDAIRKPWPWADTWPVARLRVPRLGIDRIVLEGDSGAVLAFGPGRSGLGRAGASLAGAGLAGASLAGAGLGHLVIGGHRDTHFAFLRHLAVGDEIGVETLGGGRARYRVARLRVVDHRDTAALDLDGSPRLTLVTCWPFDTLEVGGPWRYVVQAEPIDGGWSAAGSSPGELAQL